MSKKEKVRVHPCPGFIAMQIKYWRAQKKMTQLTVARASGVKYRHLQEIESGRVDVKIRTIGLISNALGIAPHKLLTPVSENRFVMCETCKNLL
jgi:transcriptional regulator with XRE-family HTH domain